ncbi:MAG: hypothetical protein FJX64_04560 [Alphaproteobacteria bacterium]|nr:hypothetical protein [Alphaproteobacteria bacterium]
MRFASLLLCSSLLAVAVACAGRQDNAGVLGARGPIAVVGTLRCLPDRPTAAVPERDCVIGLEDDALRFYRLQEGNPTQRALLATAPNVRVAIAGMFTPGADARYPTVGTIEVASITRVG